VCCVQAAINRILDALVKPLEPFASRVSLASHLRGGTKVSLKCGGGSEGWCAVWCMVPCALLRDNLAGPTHMPACHLEAACSPWLAAVQARVWARQPAAASLPPYLLF
jgi:hypothetical protein